MSATFFVTSVPVIPIPIPMSADLMAGASFTPSPVMAVTMLCARHALTILTLCSGCTLAYTEYVLTLLRSSSSDMSSRAAPSIASSALSMMPRSLPIATAVSSWSPVIMIGLMPASRHSATASLTSGLIGSIIPTRPIKMSSCSRASGEKSSGLLWCTLAARERTLSALPAILAFARLMLSASSSVIGLMPS